MKNPLVVLACMMASGLSAQQLSNYSLYREQLNVQNPAAFSREYFFEENTFIVGLNHRQQWVGVQDAPTNTAFSAELVDAEALPVVGGIGIWGVHDRTGKLGFSTFAANFKGGIPLSGRKRFGYMQHFLSLGFSLGWTQFSFKPSEIKWRDADDEVTMNDERAGYFDASLGIFLYGRKQSRRSSLRGYYLGASAPQIFEPDPDYSIGEKTILKRKRHYFAFGGIRLKTYSGVETYIEPSVYVRYVGNAPIGADANIRWKFNEFMWAGTGIGTASAHFETGVAVLDNQLKINFGYDFTYRLLYGHSGEISLFWTMQP